MLRKQEEWRDLPVTLIVIIESSQSPSTTLGLTYSSDSYNAPLVTMVNVNLIVRDTSRLLVDFCYTQLIFFIFKSHTEIHPKTYAFAQHLQTVGMKSSGALGWKHFVWVIEVLQKSKQHFPISFYATLDQDVLDDDDDAWDDDVGNHDRWSEDSGRSKWCCGGVWSLVVIRASLQNRMNRVS